MEKYLAMIVVAVVAAMFYGVSYLKKTKMYPNCDKFAQLFCELADRLLVEPDGKANLNVETLDGGLFQIRPSEEQSESIRNAMQKPLDDEVMSALRELFFLRNEIQAEASNGSFSKDKYNAITNLLYDSLNTYLAIIKDPSQYISAKDLEQFHYYFQKQTYIRNTTLPAIVSRACAARIAI